MSYTIVLRENATNEIQRIVEEGEWDETHEYMWLDGNYACDCNRELVFGREKYQDLGWRPPNEEETDSRCGMTRFDLLSVILENGTEIFPEGVHAND